MRIIKYKNEKEKLIIDVIIQALAKGGIVVSPSDTVYGLLADATDEKAVKKLIEFKNRPTGKAIAVFIPDFLMLQDQVHVNEKQKKVLQELRPGPFTIILDSKHQVSRLLESERGTLGVRLPDYQFLLNLTNKFGRPITATSANLAGKSPHYSIKSLLNQLPEKKKQLIDLIIDKGKLPRIKPSTVMDLTRPRIKIVRKGDIVFSESQKYFSESPSQTKKIARYLYGKFAKKVDEKPLIFILQGDLGVGKTVFVKGLAEILGINNIISPSFVIYYEYALINRLIKAFVHVDLYNIEDREEFKHLGLEKYLKPGNILCIEWGEKAGEIIDLLKRRGKAIYIRMDYKSEKEREIIVQN